ncbi:MAG: tyrosine-type recombinase/integrase [Phycisphaerales bacterium]|nr:tyrosine-type recombinase/integrase [Phycisphaerales bacterium]
MKRKRTEPSIRYRYFLWKLRIRNGVYLADGRGNTPPLGRHSLGTKNREEALRRLEELDCLKAVERNLADSNSLGRQQQEPVGLDDGWSQYREHLCRTEVLGGVDPKTTKRYRAVFDKFIPFAQSRSVADWNDVSVQLIEKYLNQLDRKDYAEGTLRFEANLLKQIIRWLAEGERLPMSNMIKLKVRKAVGTSTYCWKPDEVVAMIEHCRTDEKLKWMGDIIVTLAHTGMRISELVALRWVDLDFENRKLGVTNDRNPRKISGPRRRTKNRRDRSIPIHPNLYATLQCVPRNSDGFVFHGPRGGRIKPDVVRNVLIRDVIKPLEVRFPTAAGATGFANGRLHSFRHYFCSTCANAGIPEAVVMEWLGHRDSTMIKIYYHLSGFESAKQMERVAFTKKGSGHQTGE